MSWRPPPPGREVDPRSFESRCGSLQSGSSDGRPSLRKTRSSASIAGGSRSRRERWLERRPGRDAWRDLPHPRAGRRARWEAWIPPRRRTRALRRGVAPNALNVVRKSSIASASGMILIVSVACGKKPLQATSPSCGNYCTRSTECSRPIRISSPRNSMPWPQKFIDDQESIYQPPLRRVDIVSL